MKPLERIHASGQVGADGGQIADQHRQIDSPYITSREAVGYLRLPSLSALYTKIREHGLPVLRAGGALRFDKRELDAWMRGATAIELVRSKRRIG